MPFNLPPAWSSGYALPKNVLDEGLQRRALVTKQMPRGSYDNPSVGTGGYAVPTYVQDEGYGQGTYTTMEQPTGTYSGPAIPNWLNQHPRVVGVRPVRGGGKQFTVQPMSGLGDDQPLAPAFEDYGQRAAAAVLASVGRLAPAHRKAGLKATLDAVDRSLWKRMMDIAKRYQAQGATPAVALRQGLARAMSTGIAAEIITSGLRREAPQPRSLLGLGCYGCGALLAMGTTNRRVTEDDVVIVSPQDAERMVQAKYNASNWLKSIGNAIASVADPVVNIVGAVGSGVASAGSAIGSGVAKVGGAIGSGVSAAAGGVVAAGKAVVDVAGKPVDWVVTAAGAVYDAGGTVVGWVKDASGAVYDAGGKVIGWVKDAAVAVGEAVKDGLDAIGDLACDLINSSAAPLAAGGAAMIAGAPPQAGVAGVAIAQNSACGKAPPPPPPPPMSAGSSVLPTVLLAGGAVAAVYLLSRPSKKRAP